MEEEIGQGGGKSEMKREVRGLRNVFSTNFIESMLRLWLLQPLKAADQNNPKALHEW